MIITDREQLKEWLDQNYWFQDGFISRIEGDASNLRIWIGYQVQGTWVAGEKRILRELELRPSGISEWTYHDGHDFKPGYDWCIMGVDMAEKGLGLVFDTSIFILLACERLEVIEPVEFESTTIPWISDTEVSIGARKASIPEPRYWIEALQQKGQAATFRYYCSEPLPVERVPCPDYSGYYLQLPERVVESNEGLFFSHLKLAEGRLSLVLELKDEMVRPIWNTILQIISEWPLAEVRSGNVVLQEEEAQPFLAKHQLPGRLTKLMSHD